jgi:excisionase family DNA binding protein
MNRSGDRRTRADAETVRGLRLVLATPEAAAKLKELYGVMRVEEAARFLGLAVPTVQDMTYRRELPGVKLGARAVGYQLIDLIEWLNLRRRPAAG